MNLWRPSHTLCQQNHTFHNYLLMLLLLLLTHSWHHINLEFQLTTRSKKHFAFRPTPLKLYWWFASNSVNDRLTDQLSIFRQSTNIVKTVCNIVLLPIAYILIWNWLASYVLGTNMILYTVFPLRCNFKNVYLCDMWRFPAFFEISW